MAKRNRNAPGTVIVPIVVILQLAASLPLFAQSATLMGSVRTASGRGVAAASVVLRVPPDTLPVRFADTDALGRFRIAGVTPGRYEVMIRSVGFDPVFEIVQLLRDSTVSLELVAQERPVELAEVAVEADRARNRFERDAGTTARELTRDELKRVPGVAEADVLRAIEVLPGVVSTSDYSSAFNVRGGSADQNLILLDGFPIYNPFHLGGLFSVFNADVVARAELLAGGFPAEYGGRVASVLTVESDATGAGTSVDTGVSLLAARAALGATLPERFVNGLGFATARARISLRRSYFDQLLKPVLDFPYHLTDVQGLMEAWTHGGSRLTLTGYTGRDVLDFAGIDSFPLRIRWSWGNDVIGARFTSAMGEGRTMEAKVGYSRFSTDLRFPDFGDTRFRSRIGQLVLRSDFETPAGPTSLKAGMSADRLAYDNLAETGGTVFGGGKEAGWLLAGYAQLRWDPGRWLIEAGARVDAWTAGRNGDDGPAVVAAPRLAIKRFIGSGDVAIKLAAGRYAQFIHSIRDEELPFGIDIWVLSGNRAPRIVSDQVQAGIEAFTGRGWFASIEAYARSLDGVAANNPTEDPNDPFDDLVAGSGTSRGIDFYVRRDEGRIRPAVAVSWLRARRTFPDTRLGLDPTPITEYAPIFDRRLDIEFTLQATLPGNVEGGVRWNFGSGLPFTRPLGGYTTFRYGITDGLRAFETFGDSAALTIVLGPRNGERYPTYHRLDASLRKTFVKTWGRITPYVDIVNVYNRRNPLFYFYEFDERPPRRSGISMFPLLPTLGAEISFR